MQQLLNMYRPGTPYYICVLSYVYVCMYIPGAGPLGACGHI